MQPAAAPAATAPTPHRFLLPGLVFACMVVAVNSSLGAPLIPRVAAADHVSLTVAQWSLTITLLVGTVATPIMGRLGDGRQRRAVILTALALALLGSILAALPLGFGVLLVGRGLQGMGFALTPLSIATVRDTMPAEKARPAVAVLSITTVTGIGLGYPITGLIAQFGGLHAAYWFGAAVALLALIGACIVVPSSAHRPHVTLDVVGGIGLIVSLAALLVAVSEGDQWGWGSPTVIALLAVGIVVAAAWVRFELRSSHPLVDLHLIRIRTVLTADVSAVLAGVGMYLLLSLIPRLVQTPADTGYGLGDSVVIAGLALVPFSAFSYIATRITPSITRRTSPSVMLPLSSVILLLSMILFTFAHTQMWQILIVMAGTGLGVGGIFAVMPGFILRAVPASETGSAMSFNQVLRYVGYSFGSALSAVVLESHTAAGSAYPSNSGYTAAGLLAVGLWIVTGVVSAVLPGRGRSVTATAQEPAGALSEDALLADESAASAIPDDAGSHAVRH